MKMCNRIRFTALLMLALAHASAAAQQGLVHRAGGVAVKGTDVVAYFTDGKAVVGDAAYEYVWKGAKWRFASAAHRDQFVADPEKYAPQYGGYCAWAMSQNKQAPIDPDSWRVVDGKLYLNYSKEIQDQWARDIPGLVAKADAFWKAMTEK